MWEGHSSAPTGKTRFPPLLVGITVWVCKGACPRATLSGPDTCRGPLPLGEGAPRSPFQEATLAPPTSTLRRPGKREFGAGQASSGITI